MTTPARARYTGYRFPAEIIGHAVWLYFRFPLGLRMVEELLAARGGWKRAYIRLRPGSRRRPHCRISVSESGVGLRSGLFMALMPAALCVAGSQRDDVEGHLGTAETETLQQP